MTNNYSEHTNEVHEFFDDRVRAFDAFKAVGFGRFGYRLVSSGVLAGAVNDHGGSGE